MARMNSKKFYKQIRKTCLRHMMIPLISAAICMLIHYMVGFNNIFNPPVFDTAIEAIEQYDDGSHYVIIEPDILYYSGYDVKKSDKVEASYYYEVNETSCTFYRLDGKLVEDKPQVIENASITVRIMERDGLYENLISNFSNELGWSVQGMEGVTNNLVMDSTAFYKFRYLLAYFIVMTVFIYSTAAVTMYIINILLPITHLSLIKYYTTRRENIFKALKFLEKDLENNVVMESGGMYLTSDYFYNIDKNEVVIVPLEDIILAYDHGKAVSFLGIDLKVSHTIVIRTDTIGKITLTKKNAADMAVVFDYLKCMYPGILWGHTKENIARVNKIIKEKKKYKKAFTK